MKKAKLILLAGLAIAVSLTGCQKKEVKPGDVAGYDEGEQYLSIWVHSIEDTPEGQVYRESVDSFNEKYNGKYFADIEFIPRNDSGGGYSDKVNSSVLSGGLPDVLTLDGPNVAAYAENGIIQPLAELTEEERGEYLESILDQGTYNDKLYALGVMESSVGLYYNKDILEEAGIEVPDADHPWTQTEFMDILKKLKPLMDEKKGYPIDMTFPVGEASIYYYAPFIWANGGNLVSEDGLTVDGYFNSEKNVEVMNYFHQIVENKYMSEAPIENLFESGRAAFKFDGAWEVNTIYENYPDVNLGVAPYVVGDDWDGERYTPTAAREATANGTGDHGTDGAGGSLSAKSRPCGGLQLHLRSVRAAVLRGQRSARHRPGDTVSDAAGGVSVRDQVRGTAGGRDQLQYRLQVVLRVGPDRQGAGRDDDQPEPSPAFPGQQHCRRDLQRDSAAVRGEGAGGWSDPVYGFDAHQGQGEQAQEEAGGSSGHAEGISERTGRTGRSGA